MANYVKFKQGLKKDFNTTNQPLTNGMIYFVIDEKNHGSIYYDTVVDGAQATKEGAVHRVKFSGLPIEITGSVTGTGVISEDGESIVINTSTNHSHGLMHQDFTVFLSNDDTNLKWTRLGNQNGGGFWLKSIRGQAKAPAWFLPDYSAGIAFGGEDTKGIISVRYSQPGVRFAGGNGDAPVWYFTITGSNDKSYDLNRIGGHSSDSAKLDHNVTFKIASTADSKNGGNGTITDLSGSAVDLYLPTKISGFDLLQAARFQGNADTSTVAAKLGRDGNTSLPMTFNWSGQGGQPTWLWGGENGTDMYVYNPSNFKVAHSISTTGLDHDVTFKISKTADATLGETGVTTNLTKNAITFTIPSNLSGFINIQSTRFQGTADNADTVDYFHMAEEKYKYETTQKQPTAGADWCIKISTPIWNSTSETIYLSAQGDNSWGTIILKTGSQQSNWWGYATNYNGTGIIGVYKLVSNSDDVYIKVNGAYTSVRVRTTFNPTISIPTAIPDYNFTNVPYQGGFFSNAIYTDTLTFTTPKYWANIPISDNSNTETQPTFNTAYVSNWWRSTGNTGWWNETHHGGITMEDDSYVKVAGNKSFLIPNGSLKIGGNGNIFFATGYDDATLKIYGQTNTEYGAETIAIQTCFDNKDPQTSGYTTQYANRCNLLLQPRGGQVYIGKNLTTVGDTTYKLIVDGSQWTSGSQWVNGNLLFTDITGNTADTGMSLKGVYGCIGGNDGWRIAGGAREGNVGYLEISTCDDMNEPIYVRQYGGGGSWNGYVSLARTFTLLDASGRSRAPELFEAKKVHVNSELNQSVGIADIGYQFQVTGTSNFTDSVDISGVTTHHNNIQMDANYSIAKPGKGSNWNGSHNNAMIRMTSTNGGWAPLLAQKATNGYWILGHYDNGGEFNNQWLFGYLADNNLEGTTGASNSLSTTYRLLNIGGGSQRMFVSAAYNAAVGSGTQPVYVQSNGNVAACSYSLNATIEAGTANRMAYYKAVNQIGSSEHYVTSNQVGINSNTTHDFTFYVGGNSYFSNLVTVYAGNNLGVKIGNTNITAIDGSLILQNNTALRFGSSEWDWNKWAGLKYVPDSKTIVIGLADSTNFVANSVQSGGTFLITGMASVDLNKTASIKNLAIGGGIYWNPYVESAGDGSDAASITVIKNGVDNGTELRIEQQNDANDIINLVVPNSIFLNGKRAFRPADGWLRINEDSSFNYGIYTGTSLVRSDNQLQVGDSGSSFYANSAGNGYLSNNLIIRGKYAVNFFGAGDQTYTQSAFIINNTDGFVLETPRSTNEMTATNILPFRIRTRGGQPASEFAGDRLVENDCIYNLGSKTAEFATGFIRAIAARHLDADAVYNGDHTLYIGWGNAAYTDKIAFFYSPDLSSRTQFAEINSNGLYALTRFGVNGQNTSYTCYINGTLFSGAHTVYGRATSSTNPDAFYYNGALEIRESNLVGNDSSAASFNYAPRIGFHWAGRIAASLSFHNDGIFYFRKQDGSSRATIDANVNGLATNSTNAEYVANDSAYMRFHWNGQNGQPDWLWGGNEAGHMYVYNPSNFSVNYANSAGNADTTDGVHLEWSGEQAASATDWIAGWTADGKKIKAVRRSDLETKNADTVDGYHASSFFKYSGWWSSDSNKNVNDASGMVFAYNNHGLPGSWGTVSTFENSEGSAYKCQIYGDGWNNQLYYRNSSSDKGGWLSWKTVIDSGNIGSQSVNIAAKLGRSGNVAYPMTFYWDGQGGQPNWLWGGNDGTSMYVYSPSNFSVSNAGYIRSMGNQAPESGRTAARGGVYTYNMYDQTANGAPGTYLSVVGFGNGTGGHIEIAGQWIGNSNLWMRGLRDCCDDWYSWNRIWCQGNSVTGAVWNDYAECRQSDCSEPGRVVFEKGDDTLTKTEKRLQHFAGVISDTWGFSQGETDKAKTNIAVAGRVLVYTYQDRNNYKPGDCVCAAPNGTIDIMTREEIIKFPDRIVGTVSCVPDYEEWGGGKNADRDPVKVNNRIWIKVK